MVVGNACSADETMIVESASLSPNMFAAFPQPTVDPDGDPVENRYMLPMLPTYKKLYDDNELPVARRFEFYGDEVVAIVPLLDSRSAAGTLLGIRVRCADEGGAVREATGSLGLVGATINPFQLADACDTSLGAQTKLHFENPTNNNFWAVMENDGTRVVDAVLKPDESEDTEEFQLYSNLVIRSYFTAGSEADTGGRPFEAAVALTKGFDITCESEGRDPILLPPILDLPEFECTPDDPPDCVDDFDDLPDIDCQELGEC
jgi:hypothetical protein